MSIEATLKEIIRSSGKSINGLAKECGVNQPSLHFFMTGKTGLYLENLQKLVDYFGLELVKRPQQ